MNDPVMFKICKHCRTEKSPTEFYECAPGYLKSVCKVCDNRKACARALRKRFGFHAETREESGCMTYGAIAKEMGIPAWQVEKIERKALVKLRRAMSGWAL